MPSHVRLVAFLCGLLAIGLRLVDRFWWQPWSWQFDAAMSVFLWVGALVWALLIPFAIFFLVTRRMRGTPAPLQADTKRRWFVARGKPHLGGFWAILVMWIGGGAVMTERVPHQEAVRIAELPGALALSVGTVLLFVAAGVALLFANLVRVVLDPEGVQVRQLVVSRRVKWDGVLSLTIPYPLLQVDPEQLTTAIRTYVEHPERRAAIGTLPELRRLSQQGDPVVERA